MENSRNYKQISYQLGLKKIIKQLDNHILIHSLNFEPKHIRNYYIYFIISC